MNTLKSRTTGVSHIVYASSIFRIIFHIALSKLFCVFMASFHRGKMQKFYVLKKTSIFILIV